MPITYDALLNTVRLLIYFSFVLLSCYSAYYYLTTREQRKTYRTKIQKELEQKKLELVNQTEKSSLAQMINRAGNPLRLSAFRFQLIRWTIVIVLIFSYILMPIIFKEFTPISLAYIMSIIIFTSPTGKISLTKLILNQLYKFRTRKKREELFTMYDMIKAELNSLSEHQEINTHNLLKSLLPYFNFIDVGVIKFMRNWKISPELAKNSFSEEIGGEHAEVIANILYRMDLSSKSHVIELIRNAADVFSSTYVEQENRRTDKRLVGVDLLLFAGNLMSLVWTMIMIVSMFSGVFDTINK